MMSEQASREVDPERHCKQLLSISGKGHVALKGGTLVAKDLLGIVVKYKEHLSGCPWVFFPCYHLPICQTSN